MLPFCLFIHFSLPPSSNHLFFSSLFRSFFLFLSVSSSLSVSPSLQPLWSVHRSPGALGNQLPTGPGLPPILGFLHLTLDLLPPPVKAVLTPTSYLTPILILTLIFNPVHNLIIHFLAFNQAFPLHLSLSHPNSLTPSELPQPNTCLPGLYSENKHQKLDNLSILN